MQLICYEDFSGILIIESTHTILILMNYGKKVTAFYLGR